MPMKNPPYPGRSIKDACLEPLGLNITEGAKVLGVTRNTLSRVINGQNGISPNMAIRLEKAGWSNADHWLRLQTAYELAQSSQGSGPHQGDALTSRSQRRRSYSRTPLDNLSMNNCARGSVNKCVNRHQAAFSWVTWLTGTPLAYWAPW